MKKFRKLLALVLAVVMVCAVGTTAWATNTSLCGHSDHDYCTEIEASDKHLDIIRADMINTGINPLDTFGIVSCIHKWTNWKLLTSWNKENLNDFSACFIYVREEYRYCLECNETKIRQTEKQLSHSWSGNAQYKECTICGDVIAQTR